eukprot:10744-Eustigmatos_ZCMA.PRE.1
MGLGRQRREVDNLRKQVRRRVMGVVDALVTYVGITYEDSARLTKTFTRGVLCAHNSSCHVFTLCVLR